jgi:hypothetical protein
MKSVRDKNKGIYIVPRFQFQNWQEKHFMSLINDPGFSQTIQQLICQEMETFDLDGVVLEVGIPVRFLQDFLRNIAKTFSETFFRKKFLFLVIPPMHTYHPGELAIHRDLLNLEKFVDGFSLMTYDYTASAKYIFSSYET